MSKAKRTHWLVPPPPEDLSARLPREFFQRPTLEVAPTLLGNYLVHADGDRIMGGRIVELEAYCGPDDLGAHTSGGRRTARNEAMYGPKGHAYIYLIYGMYWCVNAVAGPEGEPQACLIRALEPVLGIEHMLENLQPKEGADVKLTTLCRGPGKLCKALDLDKRHYGMDLLKDEFFIVPGSLRRGERIGQSPRIGIDYAGEYKDVPWRFYVKDNPCVSGPAKWRR